MSKLKTKTCPHCENILERLYHRERNGEKQTYAPIGYICPTCKEKMIVMDTKI